MGLIIRFLIVSIKFAIFIALFALYIFIYAFSAIVQAGGSTQSGAKTYFKEVKFDLSSKGIVAFFKFMMQICVFSLILYFVLGVFF